MRRLCCKLVGRLPAAIVLVVGSRQHREDQDALYDCVRDRYQNECEYLPVGR